MNTLRRVLRPASLHARFRVPLLLALAATLAPAPASAVSGAAAPKSVYDKPGAVAGTPVSADSLDAAAYREWFGGNEQAPENGPEWILWTAEGRIGFSGQAFGKEKTPGPRHLRVGFTNAIPAGSVLLQGNVRVSALKAGAAYPGNPADESLWIPAQRIGADGARTAEQADSSALALWILPPGTLTRALRFTHDAAATDAEYAGQLSGAIILKPRFDNLAPSAAATAKSNGQKAAKLANGAPDGWGAWENISQADAEASDRAAVSEESPEELLLVWPEARRIDGLMGVWCGFGSAVIQAYAGPPARHPREASESDWKTVASPSGFSSGYPAALVPLWFPFAQPVQTRALRVLLTSPTPVSHPHVANRTAKGRRVWAGELLALSDLGEAPPAARSPAAAEEEEKEAKDAPHPPIPVRFSLPKDGYVTLVIENANGERVRNLVSETFFKAGDNTAWWDGTDDLGRDIDAANHGLYHIPARLVSPGSYTARGLWRGEVKAFYEFSPYSAGSPPWNTPDHTGAWLANHSAPQAAVFVPASKSPTGQPAVFLGAYVTEGPDGLIWTDLDGRKRGGMKWIGGNWTAAPFLCADLSPGADTNISAFVASVWETAKQSGKDELRITALVRNASGGLDARPVHKAEIPRLPGQGADGDGDTQRDEIGGVAAWGGSVYCAMRGSGRLLKISAATGKLEAEIPLASPRGLAFGKDGLIYAISGQNIVRFSFAMAPSQPPVLAALQEPVALALDPGGNIYVSVRGESHQVKVLSPEGKHLRDIGLPGAPAAGPYNPLRLQNPEGLAIDSKGQLWVAENDYLPKRVSVWTPDGRLLQAFYGPGKYGGGGTLDSRDATRFYYADEDKGAMEFELDWEKGSSRLKNVLYRRSPSAMPLPFRAAAPETALYREGRRYFVNCYNTNPTGGHGTGALFLERGSSGAIEPAVLIGNAARWDLLATAPFLPRWPEEARPDDAKKKKPDARFSWTDENGDAQAQPAEIEISLGGATGVTVMDDLSFLIANSSGKTLRLRPLSFTAQGAPRYSFAQAETLAEGVAGPKSSGGAQALADASGEAVVLLGVAPFDPYSISGVKNGKAVWSYPNPWPGLHASHHAARPTFPGQVIGATRLLGGFFTPPGSETGPLWAVNGNMGNFYIFTRDGLFVATVFKDVRQGRLWKMLAAERGMPLDGISLHDENFWPTIAAAPGGKVYAIDGANCALVRLDGLETLRRLPPVSVPVSPADLAEAAQYTRLREEARQRAFGGGLLRAPASAPAGTFAVDGDLRDWKGADWVEIDKRGAGANFNSTAKPYDIRAAVAVSATKLYAAWDTADPKLLANSGEIPLAPFKTGGALDLMLGADPAADPARRAPVAGDSRLLVTLVPDGKDPQKTKPLALLYRAVDPSAPASARVPFASPWRAIHFARVEDVTSKIEFATDDKGAYEISVPLALLDLTPAKGRRNALDLGVLRGNGSETTARIYWSNKATAITADVPSEAEITPSLWGAVEWR
jgi:hypothetical protein